MTREQTASEIRPLQLPGDLPAIAELGLSAFHYPDHEGWNMQPDEQEGIVDTVNALQRLWPVMRLLRFVVPALRDVLCGYVCMVGERPAGLVNFQRRGRSHTWYIMSVAVLPEYRRQGIARRLVRATLDFVRAREGTVVLLDVISGNVPAYSLYRQLGFEHFAGSITFDYEPEQALPEHPVPHGYRVLSLKASDWTRCTELEQRIVPTDVQRYEPRDPAQYVQSLPDRLVAYIINQIQGTREERVAVRTVPGDRMVAWGGYRARMRRGGVNRITMHVDPVHAQLARPLLHYLIRSAGAISPRRRVEFGVSPWQHTVLEAARETGLTERLEYHRLGIRL